MLARKRALLDCSKLNAEVVGSLQYPEVVEAGEFVHTVRFVLACQFTDLSHSASRVSSLFKVGCLLPCVEIQSTAIFHPCGSDRWWSGSLAVDTHYDSLVFQNSASC